MTALKARHGSYRLKSPFDMGPVQHDGSPSPTLDILETSMEEESFESRSRHRDLKLNDSLNSDDSKRFHRGSTIRKSNSQYHKLFKEVPEQEMLRKVYSCALQRDIFIQGRLYISSNWLCFYAYFFGKDIKVSISVTSVVLVKKRRTAGLLPNGLVIRTKPNEKYIFVSFISRDNVYDELRKICSHLQHDSKKSLIVNQSPDTCDSLPLEDYRFHLDLKRKLTNGSSSSLPETEYQPMLRNSTSSLSSPEAESSSYHSQSFQERVVRKEKLFELDAAEGIGKMEYGILRILVVIVIILLASSIYMTFRVYSLEQQLGLLDTASQALAQKR
ncbi:GRAM domain-containing protein 2A isoform X2 [Stegostoma tigrinum]|uniref:GRAM domain-containing protein 2A isoform X1 n=2 Tax=Stegostoma tigrinum TaxID=3053191 RepID=UPI0028707F0E|nr:GRAM domain-containing protein 2A isoform X1 [Stegostoma tigrinum]XP_059496108.1 GRAM domain-containing protein 2A isoform X2 [Stegostoma tigrinum]